MREELSFEKNTPADIFRMIDNQSVSIKQGEQLIQIYGDRRAVEAVIEYQKSMGVEIEKEIEEGIIRIGKLLEELYQRTLTGCIVVNKSKKGKHKK